MQDMPLSDLIVLDLTIARAGPVCVRQLADWGADVIQVGPPPATKRSGQITDPERGDYQNLHRNKRSLNLDLQTDEGRALFLRLAARADVVVENFRPDVKHRLKIDYEALKAINPRLIYASISGFGQEGPYSNRPALDQIIQGMAGVMSVTGVPGQGPMRAGFAASDVLAGLYLAQAILIALIDRARSGQGQWVQTSLLEAMLAGMDFQVARVLVDHETPASTGNDHPTVPLMGLFPASDGVVNIGVVGQGMFQILCDLLGAPEVFAEPDYATGQGRIAHRHAVNAAIARHTSKFSRAELVAQLNAAGIPCGPVYDVAEALADAQTQHLGVAWPYEHPSLGPRALVGQPFRMTGAPQGGVRRVPPAAGADTTEILHEIGLGEDEIAGLRARRII